MPMHVHRLSWCRCEDIVEWSLSLQYSVLWMICCTIRQLFVLRWFQVSKLVESKKKLKDLRFFCHCFCEFYQFSYLNLAVHHTNSTDQCCSKVHMHSNPSTRLSYNTSTPFQVDNCKNNARQCNSKLQCSSRQVEQFACKS